MMLAWLLPVLALAAVEAPPEPPAESRTTTLQTWIRGIVAADYRGERAELDRLYAEGERHLAEHEVTSRVRYWRGFAKWRRAMNGANETPTPGDLVADLEVAVAELRSSGELDPAFVDAAKERLR